MKKNVASQVVGVQMVTAADGTAFTGAVTAVVTGDGGTQGGGGACTHEGNGFHTYLPTQAETNYDHVAFTFAGSGAIPATVQIYTQFPQTGDSFARIGATGSGLTSLATQASVNTIDDYVDTEIADILAAVDTEILAIKAKTDLLPGATMAELPQGIPSATPSMEQALMALYMSLRNRLDVTASTKSVTNDAGTVIFKKALSDDGTTYSEAEAVSGP